MIVPPKTHGFRRRTSSSQNVALRILQHTPGIASKNIVHPAPALPSQRNGLTAHRVIPAAQVRALPTRPTSLTVSLLTHTLIGRCHSDRCFDPYRRIDSAMIGCQGFCGFEDSTKIKVRNAAHYVREEADIVALEDQDEHAVVRTLSASFLGDPNYGAKGEGLFGWVFRELTENGVDASLAKIHRDCMAYYCRYCFILGRRAGRQFAIVDEPGRPGRRTFKAIMLTFPPYACPGHEVAPFLRFLGTILVVGAPFEDNHAKKLMGLYTSIVHRRRILEATLKECHMNVPPDDGAYWYVHMIGTSPAHRGQKLGKKLLTFLQSIACGDGASIYLECHRGVTAFYKELGFESRLPFEQDDPAAPNDETARLSGDGMICSPFSGRNPLIYRPFVPPFVI